MFLFLKLYLAHLIGDFVLQFEELYQLKTKKFSGYVYHVAIHAALSFILTAPLLRDPFLWIFIPTIATIHLFQDLLKYRLSNKYPQYRFFLFVGDQVFHFLFLSTIFLFPYSEKTAFIAGLGSFDLFYNVNEYMICLIYFIFVIFAIPYTLHSFRTNYIKNSRPDHYITSFEMFHGMVERILIAGVFLFAAPGVVWLAAPLAFLLRIPFKKLHNIMDIIFMLISCLFLAFIFRGWI